MNDLVTFARDAEQQAVDTLRNEASLVARAAADAAVRLVVQDSASAEMANEYLQKIDAGKRFLEAKRAALTAPYRKIIEDHIRYPLGAVLEELDRGGKAVRASLTRYMAAENERLRREQRLQQIEADKAAKAQSALGDDAPPPMEVPAPAPVREIRTASGAVHMTKVLEMALEDASAAPVDWIRLDTVAARADWNDAAKRGEVNPEGALWRGVRFSYRSTIARTA